MCIVMEDLSFNNIAFGIIMLLVVALACGIVAILNFRFSHLRKRINFSLESLKTSEVLGPKEWEQRMLELAGHHKDVKPMRYNFVLDDYNQIAYKKLNQIRNKISEQSTDIIALIPAARWLFDNFQMMYREIKKARTSETSYEKLPLLKEKEFRGFPRIYIVAKNMVALTGGHINEENIAILLNAYQQEITLTDKELWVLPEMLGFCLLESIIEESENIIRIIELKTKADKFISEKRKLNQNTADISELLTELKEDLKNNYSFHSHVIYLLRNMSIEDATIQKYIDYHFNLRQEKRFNDSSRITGKQLKQSNIFLEEGKIESYLETSIRTLIVSLRDINEIDSEKLFQEYSQLEHILSKDPDGVYASMDFESRGMYRSVVVRLSHKMKKNEEKIAQDCLELAVEGRDDLYCSHHVGTYLIGKGYPLLIARIKGKSTTGSLKRKRNWVGILYILSYLLIFLFANFTLSVMMYRLGKIEEPLIYVLILIISFPILASVAVEIANFIFTKHIKVRKIPSLDYMEEIPDRARTFVVMPVIISNKKQGIEFLNRLQKQYLANRQSNLFYALLVDYSDYHEEIRPEDKEIETALTMRIKELNDLYPSEHQRFSLFARRRKWNEAENCYMGWERKRGKLEEFNYLLQGADPKDTSFSTLLCDIEILTSFKYVITLDADTNLIRDNAAKLVGLIDHPINQPVVDPVSKKVLEGYVVIQPTVRNHIIDKKGSRFTEIFGGQSGLAHYAAVISDIYQDIFNQAIYCGKGIYDVKAFHELLHNVIPENSVLSHDLLESCYARTAFASTAKIMDNFPSNVISFTKREHRWIRGDWQLLSWLFKPTVGNGKKFCALSRWKIFDNLRRSKVPLSKTLLIILNLALIQEAYYLWIPVIFFNDLFHIVVLLCRVFMQKMTRPNLALVYKSLFKELWIMVQRALIELVLTPYRAYVAIDAELRTLYRLLISKKNLLQWNTSENVDASISNKVKGYFLTMWTSLIPALILILLLIISELPAFGIFLYGVISLAWATAFYLAFCISQPKKALQGKEYLKEKELLMDTARRTWQFFKSFSKKDNNWLCPDNYQLSQVEKISDKTSPTNIGLQLLSIMSARDFGFETVSATIRRVEALMETLQKLEKWKGHLYNWYQIKTLDVLSPAYISTVDSGNFLGDLIALKNGIQEQIEQPVIQINQLQELRRTLMNTLEECMDEGEREQYELKEEYKTIGDFVEDATDIWDDLNSRDLKPGEKTCWSFELADSIEQLVEEIACYKLKEYSFSACPSLRQLAQMDNKSARNAIDSIHEICNKIDCILANVDFHFLFNEKRNLFHIGYHVSSHMLDAGCYDLMASEAMLTSFLAIARGDVPVKHWHKLGRPLTMIKGIPCLVSWSGTMFEYLMPNLVLKEYEGSIYSETFQAAVLQHINYAKEAGIPWGISESQYYRFDLNSNYQYKAFGVPKLRLQPVRKNSYVVTPYATMLALDYTSEECFENLKKLIEMGVYGKYGFYEAIDFNHPDSVNMTPYCIVRSFMTHHQGMILVAINNFLNQGIMRKRFHTEPMVMATEVLLEEKRQSHLISIAKRGYTIRIGKIHLRDNVYSNRYVNTVSPEIPVINYLSNNKYSLMITSDGDGFSRYKNMMLYRWRADRYANTGNYIYIKDKNTERLWSTAYHPTKTEPDEYQVIFSPHMAEFKRADGDVFTHTEVSLSPNHNIEIRRVSLTNRGKETKILEVTSYLEVVCDSHLAELSHPAFNKLFIESEFLEEQRIFLSKRRSGKEKDNPYMLHMVTTGEKLLNQIEYENDRFKFIGRNNTLENPEVIVNSRAFSNHSGFCNDPIMSLRATLSLEPGETACLSFITGICHSKEEAIVINKELNVCYRIDDIFEKFKLQRNIELKYLEITRSQLYAFQDLISPLFYPSKAYRGPRENIRRNFKDQSFLWKFGVSGDNPIMLLRIKSIEEAGIIRDVLKAYEYLRINHVMVDLIILSEAKHGYMQELDNLVNEMTSSLRIYDANSERPSLFMLHSYQMIPSEIDLLLTVARVVFTEKTGIYFRNIKENQSDLMEE